MKAQCPHCNTIFNNIANNLVNQIVKCSNCKEEFVAEDLDTPDPPPKQYQQVPEVKIAANNNSGVNLSSVKVVPSTYCNAAKSTPKVQIHWSIHVYNGIALVPLVLGLICLCYALAGNFQDDWQRISVAAFGLLLFFISGVLIAFGRLLSNVEKIEQYLRNKD